VVVGVVTVGVMWHLMEAPSILAGHGKWTCNFFKNIIYRNKCTLILLILLILLSSLANIISA